MYLFWKLVHLSNILKTDPRKTFGSHSFAALLVSSAALVAIGATVAVAKIAFQEQSWWAFLMLIVTIVQVREVQVVQVREVQVREVQVVQVREVQVV